MGIFPDAKESVVGSDRNANSVETLWLSPIPAKMKKIQLNMKALEWPQDYKSIF